MTDTHKANSADGDSIKVAVRVRPRCETDLALCLQADSAQSRIIMNSKPEKIYTFDYVADMDVTQESVFSAVGRNIIDACINGYNGTIFAYGQTGSGKTFTMLGPNEDSANFQHDLRGVIPRSFEYIFNLIERQQELHGENVKFLTTCSFLEIYNEQIYDLLDEASNGLQLRENIKKGVFVDGLIEQVVSNAAEAYQVLNLGWVNRTVAETSMNRESSRSHAVFTLTLQSKTLNNGVWNVKSSSLNLVDLAGSERQKDTHTTGVRLKEAGSINKSLSVLGNVIMSLVDLGHGKNRHVPYRDSRLTFLLRDSLGGNAKTCVIACVHPGAKSFGESLSTIHFARRAKMIKNKAVVNEDAEGNVIKLQAEIRRLKDALTQYQAGNIPSEPTVSAIVTDQDGSNDGSLSQDVSVWVERFKQAMYLRQQAVQEREFEKKKLRNKDEVIHRKEKSIQSKNMILKFRDESLKKYDKACKEKRDLDEDEKDLIISKLREEIGVLEEQVNRTPLDLRKAEEENTALRREIQRIRSTPGVYQIDMKRAAELHEIFNRLQADLEAAGGNQLEATPKERSSAASVTVERQKVQLDELNEQLKQYKHDLQAQKESFEKEKVELKAGLESLTTRNAQLEKILKTQQISGQVERETMSQLHMETIKSLTPNKNKLPLGTPPTFNMNKAFAAPGSESAERSRTNSLDCDIFGEMMPSSMIGAIEDELRSTKDELNELQTRLENKDTEIVNYCTDVTRLKSENSQLEEILQKERKDWVDKEEELARKMAELQSKMDSNQDDYKLMEEKIRDYEIMMDARDRSIKDQKKEIKSLFEEKSRALSELSTENLKLKTSLTTSQQELESSQQECARRKESEETAQETLKFAQSQVDDLEEQIIAKDMDITNYQKELETLEKKIRIEEDRNSELCKRLAEEGGKEEQLIKLSQKLKETENTYQVCIQEKEKALNDCEKLKVDLEEDKQAMGVVMNKQAEISKANEALKEKVNSLKKDIDQWQSLNEEWKEREAQLNVQIQGFQLEKEKLNENLEAMKLKLAQKEAELECQQQDLDQVTEMFDKLQNEKEEAVLKSKELEAQNKNLALELQTKATEQMMAMESRDNMEKEMQKVKENDGRYHESIAKLQVQLKARTTDYQKACQDIELLKEKAKQEEDKLNAEVLLLTTQRADIQSQLSTKKVELQAMEDRNSELEKRLELHAPIFQEVLELRELKQRHDDSEEQMTKARNEISRLQTVLESRQIEVETLKSENDHLVEQNKKNMDENLRLLDENTKLTGHANPRQRIHHLENLKERLRKEEEAHSITRHQLSCAEMQLKRYKPQTAHGQSPLKRPQTTSSLNSQVSTPNKRQHLENDVGEKRITTDSPCLKAESSQNVDTTLLNTQNKYSAVDSKLNVEQSESMASERHPLLSTENVGSQQ